jgi:hypothetical protein
MVVAWPAGSANCERPAKWTIEGVGDDLGPGMNGPVVQSLRVIGLEAQRDAPAGTLDRH